MTRVFIAYARPDQSQVKEIVENFRNIGLEVAWDADLEPGKWRDQLRNRIKSADHFVWIMSSSSVDSREVSREFEIASESGAQCHILSLGDAQPSQALSDVAQLHWFSVHEVFRLIGSILRSTPSGGSKDRGCMIQVLLAFVALLSVVTGYCVVQISSSDPEEIFERMAADSRFRGPKGATGDVGPQGEKGDPGGTWTIISEEDDSNEMNLRGVGANNSTLLESMTLDPGTWMIYAAILTTRVHGTVVLELSSDSRFLGNGRREGDNYVHGPTSSIGEASLSLLTKEVIRNTTTYHLGITSSGTPDQTWERPHVHWSLHALRIE